MRPMTVVLTSLWLLAAPAFAQQDIEKINGAVQVTAGQPHGDLSTVNGRIEVGAGAEAAEVSTVNGAVELGERARVRSVEVVNGSVRLGREVQVARDVETVNGSIYTDHGSRIGGDVTTVNGGIGLVATHVEGDVETVNGDMTVGVDSRVQGGLRVHASSTLLQVTPRRKLRIVVGPGAVVEGASRFEREVVLYVHKTARMGPVTGATPVAFDTPSAPKD